MRLVKYWSAASASGVIRNTRPMANARDEDSARACRLGFQPMLRATLTMWARVDARRPAGR